MTALGQGFAAAIGGRLVSVDGRTGFDRGETAAWRGDDVVVISHFDGLDPAAQVAVVEAGRRPAIVLAKRHPIANRMPFPPDDDTRERFLFGGDLDYGDTETELRIVNEVRDRDGDSSSGQAAAIDLRELHAMRAAAAGVDIPADVRRHAVEAVAATRTDPDILLGASAVATLALVQAAAAAAITSGRARSTVGDVDDMLEPILSHRLVYREGHSPTIRT
jgi:MoxR-like ATPase